LPFTARGMKMLWRSCGRTEEWNFSSTWF